MRYVVEIDDGFTLDLEAKPEAMMVPTRLARIFEQPNRWPGASRKPNATVVGADDVAIGEQISLYFQYVSQKAKENHD